MPFSKLRVLLVLALILLGIGTQLRPAQALNFLNAVDATTDNEDPLDGVCTLREAMNTAFNNITHLDCGTGSATDTDVITFSSSLIVTLSTGHTSLPNVTDDNPNGVDVQIDGGNSVILIHNYAFDVDPGAGMVLSNITLMNAQASAIQTHPGSTTTLDHVTFTNNTSPANGGAIYNNGTMTISNSSFGLNTVPQIGGAIYSTGTLTINSSTFTDNSAGYRGGAIASNGTLTINATTPATTFSANHSTTTDEFGGGGALFLDNASVTTISGVTFTQNTSNNGRGGAIYGGNFGAASGSTITGSVFTGNQNSGMLGNGGTNGDGGAMFVQGPWTISTSYFGGNTALTGSGGGLAVFSQGNLSMDNSTISGNTAGEVGGGVSSQNNGTATLTNVTVVGNTGSAQLDSSANFNLRNTLIANPASGSNCSGSFTNGGGSLNFPDSSCGAGVTGDPKITPDGNSFALNAGSAATDIGDQTYCNAFATDQVGSPRAQDGNGDGNAVCDAGSREGGTNSKPTANADNYAVDEGATLNVAANGVLGNDTDPEGAQLTAVLESNVSNGSLTLNSDGSFDYTPSSGFEGDDTFTYRASDGASNSDPATVTITVNNAAPTANDDTFNNIDPSMPFIFSTTDLLVNDTDPGNDALTVILPSNPLLTANNGQVLMVGTVLTYNPNGGGADTFTYTVSDGSLTSASATVTLNVDAPADDPPEITTIMDQVTAMDTPIDVFFTVSDDNTQAPLLIPVGTSDNQTLVPDANIVVTLPCLENATPGDCKATITPAANQTGMATITLTVSDGALTAQDTFVL
ncbi:MAG: cadherin-like domain-containing protein, partial [Anaerolinea sp.]|nr:cadherin-like domain-containing protein [Anaerolinea sp.]